jgi:hypothetical protein
MRSLLPFVVGFRGLDEVIPHGPFVMERLEIARDQSLVPELIRPHKDGLAADNVVHEQRLLE